jgi:alpha-beta hydrolase superfamily lysophospholipase
VTAVLDRLRTADGERLAAWLRRGPGATCVVLAHGFSGSSGKPAVRRIVDGLAAHVSVLAYDARGHGRSTGATTLGDRDGYFPASHALDLASAAREPVELWMEEGFGHAEAGASPELVDRLGAHLPVLLGRRT